MRPVQSVVLWRTRQVDRLNAIIVQAEAPSLNGHELELPRLVGFSPAIKRFRQLYETTHGDSGSMSTPDEAHAGA